MDPDRSLSPDSLSQHSSRQVSVPAPWQSQSPDLRFYTGIAWYQRSISIPLEWLEGASGQRMIFLGFGAVDYIARVWMNGVLVGEHEGGYLPFELDVTQAARPGENRLTVCVEDNPDIFPEIPHGKQSWYGPISGIWQPVWIEDRPALHIRNVKITPTGSQVCVRVTLNGSLAPQDSLTYEVLSPAGKIVSSRSARENEVELPVSSPLLWEPDTPSLYRLVVTLRSAGNEPPTDRVEESFGFRTIETREGTILLNGKPLYLRGALDQDYYPELIYTPPSLEYIEAQFRKAKEMGLNCLRVHIKIADPRYYIAADRVGLLLWSELPNWILLSSDARRRGLETLQGMVERDWNHPSIIIWTIINESWGVDLTNPEHCSWVSQAYDRLKELDPHRLIVSNSACATNFHIVSDIQDFHNYYAIPDNYAKWRKWVRIFASRPGWAFAFPYENNKAWKKFVLNPWVNRQRLPAPVVRMRGDEPLVVSEFGNWGLPDVEKLRQCYGGRDPWWFETGFEWEQGIVYPHGFEQRFRAFHLDRAFPHLGDLIQASQAMQFEALKYEIEQIRLRPSLMGYIITEFTDVHWESNGLLDMCRNPKNHFNKLSTINSPDLIIPDWRRVAYWQGETARVAVSLSHFSDVDLSGSTLQWQLAGWPDIQGRFEKLAPGAARVSALGAVRFRAPEVDRPQRLRLEFQLVQRNGQLAAMNTLDLYIYPRLPDESKRSMRLYAPTLAEPLQTLGYEVQDDLFSADLAIVETLTDDFRSYVQTGGQVLWLAETRKSLQTYLGSLKIMPRKKNVWQGDWANNLNWINQDKLFRSLPARGVVDFSFVDLIPDHVITGLSVIDFAIRVHAGLFVGWIHRPVALIAERRFGRGRLMACTFRLSRQMAKNPTASYMVKEMIGYLLQTEAEHTEKYPSPGGDRQSRD